MTGFLALFIIGSFWWYIVTGGFFIWAIALTEKESLFWVFASLLMYLCFLSFIGKVNVFSFMFYHPLKTFLYVLGYFVLGIIWSFIKWWLKVSESAQRCKKELDEFMGKSQSSDPKRLKEDWESQIKHSGYEKPIVSKNKTRISVWIVYWPFSLLWSLIHDIVRRMVEQFVIKFQKFYQRISDRAYKDLEPKPLDLKKSDD